MQALFLAAVIGLTALSAHAQVSVSDPWLRATVPQQKTTGAFMRLSSVESVQVVDARSPIAESVEIHSMNMENNIMKMRAVPSLAITAGKTVELKPGGYHMMFIGLKQQVKEGDVVPVTLVIEAANKKRETIDVKIPVKAIGAKSSNAQHH
jgi:copper(I)-binding protein